MTSFPFDIVGFDLDGTLLDTHVDIGAAVNHALAHAGRAAIPVAEIRGLVGGGAKRMLARALERTGGGVSDELFLDLHDQTSVPPVRWMKSMISRSRAGSGVRKM